MDGKTTTPAKIDQEQIRPETSVEVSLGQGFSTTIFAMSRTIMLLKTRLSMGNDDRRCVPRWRSASQTIHRKSFTNSSHATGAPASRNACIISPFDKWQLLTCKRMRECIVSVASPGSGNGPLRLDLFPIEDARLVLNAAENSTLCRNVADWHVIHLQDWEPWTWASESCEPP